jgi:alpha-tubulin suppressor-like RCC1 family protein
MMLIRFLEASLLFSVALCAATSSAASQPITLALGDSAQIRVAPGTAVSVPVRIEVGAGSTERLASFGGGLTWATTRLRFDSVRAVDATWTVTANTADAANGQVLLSVYSTAGLMSSATVARAFFTSTTQPGGTRVQLSPSAAGSELGLNILDLVAVRPLDACVAPTGRWGDVTDDGVVNVIDAQQIARFSVGLTVGNPTALAARADVNADGVSNIIDAQQIARFSVSLSAAARINTATFVAPIPEAVRITSGVAPVVRQGQALQLAVDPRDGAEASMAGCVPLTYASESPEIATVSRNGVVTGTAPGLAWLSVTASGGKLQRMLVRVAQPNGVMRGTRAFVGGSSHTCAVALEGSGYCWGSNGSGELGDGTTTPSATPKAISGGLTFSMLSAGGARTCGLTIEGVAHCWGLNTGALPSPVPTSLAFSTITSGSSHHCALTSSGAAFCWGGNSSGQLGDGTTTTSTSPVAVAGGRTFVDIDASGTHTCALTVTGAIFCWGLNGSGQLGNGSTGGQSSVPVAVAGANEFVSIATQANLSSGVWTSATCALSAAGDAFCWGTNASGQLGDGTTTSRNIPGIVSPVARFVRIAGGTSHACALSSTGTVYCWGDNSSGQLGDGSYAFQSTPVPVTGSTPWKAVSAVGTSSCGLSNTGTSYCWGNNVFGQLGIGTMPFRTTPVAVAGGVSYTSLAAGLSSTCGISASTVRCWGSNASGELGVGTASAPRSTPALVAGSNSYNQVTVGERFACALATTGSSPFCWGANDRGQLGDGTTVNKSVPTAVSGAPVFTSIVAGLRSSCGRGTTGAVQCWGWNGFGQLGDGTTTNQTSPVTVAWSGSFNSISAGLVSFCGLDATGAAYCWGYNGYGQLGDGTTTQRSSPVAVSGGLTFGSLAGGAGNNILYAICGLTTDKRAFCWGGNDKGQLGNGTVTAGFTSGSTVPSAVTGGFSFVSIANGGIHACGLTETGAAYCWGLNSSGQLGDGTTTDRASPTLVAGAPAFVALTAGERHTCGRTAAGVAYCWGSNATGQLGNGETLPFLPTLVSTNGVTFRAP